MAVRTHRRTTRECRRPSHRRPHAPHHRYHGADSPRRGERSATSRDVPQEDWLAVITSTPARNVRPSAGRSGYRERRRARVLLFARPGPGLWDTIAAELDRSGADLPDLLTLGGFDADRAALSSMPPPRSPATSRSPHPTATPTEVLAAAAGRAAHRSRPRHRGRQLGDTAVSDRARRGRPSPPRRRFHEWLHAAPGRVTCAGRREGPQLQPPATAPPVGGRDHFAGPTAWPDRPARSWERYDVPWWAPRDQVVWRALSRPSRIRSSPNSNSLP